MKAPLHLALLTLGCLGLGALGGFGLVYSIYRAECHDRLAAQAAECRRTTRDAGDCLAHETRDAQEQQAVRLQAQLTQVQAALETSQNVATMAQREAQDARAAAAVVHQEGQERARQADQAARAQQQQCQIQTAEREACAAQWAVCTSGLAVQVTAVAHAQQAADEAQAQHAALAQEWSVWQASWQARARAQTVLRYGAGPLQVEITLDLGGGHGTNLQSLVLQLDRLDALPLTTATFVYLVASGLYTGTPLQPSGNLPVLRGGQLPHAAARVRANLTQRWAAHGLEPDGGHLWAAQETTTTAAPCPRYGIGVDWEHTGAGDFFILLEYPSATAAAASSRRHACLGRVVHGMEWLPAVTTATIAATRILVGHAAAARDEL
jgi:cyclophilin family peptidyl-prolyl cis-trans isomerase